MTANTANPARWMSLGEASRALEINEATLRQWADRGRLRAYRTPGGHRRFWREDVETLISGDAHRPAAHPDPDPEDLALRKIRRKVSHIDLAEQPWMESFQAGGRDRMRLFGRRLLSLLLQDARHGRNRRKGETLSETHMLGHEYGSEMAARGVPLTDSVQAFLFFRQAVLDAARPERLRQVVEISDRVLLGLVDAYNSRLTTEDGAAGNGETTPAAAALNGGPR